MVKREGIVQSMTSHDKAVVCIPNLQPNVVSGASLQVDVNGVAAINQDLCTIAKTRSFQVQSCRRVS